MSVLELAGAKIHLNLSGDDEARDAELQTFIDAAEAAIVRRVGPLEPTEITERVRPCGRTMLSLSHPPVLSLTTVQASDAGTVNVANLEVTEGGIVRFSDGAGFGSRWYDVTYSAGRDPEAFPADLLLAVKELVRHLWSTQRGGDSSTRRPGSQSSATVSNALPGSAYSFPTRVEQLLVDHEQPGFA